MEDSTVIFLAVLVCDLVAAVTGIGALLFSRKQHWKSALGFGIVPVAIAVCLLLSTHGLARRLVVDNGVSADEEGLVGSGFMLQLLAWETPALLFAFIGTGTTIVVLVRWFQLWRE